MSKTRQGWSVLYQLGESDWARGSDRAAHRGNSSLIRLRTAPHSSALLLQNPGAGTVSEIYDEWHGAEDGVHHDAD